MAALDNMYTKLYLWNNRKSWWYAIALSIALDDKVHDNKRRKEDSKL
jgi:hypothetical protein